MEFIKKLVEREGTLKNKDLFSHAGKSTKNNRLRIFKQIKISEDISLSIQAGYGFHCTPLGTIDLKDYSKMELAIKKNRELCSAEEVITNKEIISELSKYFQGTLYPYVPVELIERFYQELVSGQTKVENNVKFNIGDFVEFRKSRWIIINIFDDGVYDLMNGYHTEYWNANEKELTLVAKFKTNI